MTFRTGFALCCAAGLLLACRAEPAPNAAQPLGARTAPSGLDMVPLTIHSRGRDHRFIVEVARTPDQQAQGLMHRERLGADEGMIFPFPSPRPASFWMRNTLIPLDMIFIRQDGTIARIAANTVPLSEEPVGSGEPVAAVLELRGGRAAELGIQAGDRVSWPG
ncbi:MAG: DUF192 domain-containing protein [Pseudomonadota bacterium]|nr:DUF192 domain-containing protein [Pseudomonadota bacterium]